MATKTCPNCGAKLDPDGTCPKCGWPNVKKGGGKKSPPFKKGDGKKAPPFPPFKKKSG